jgi:hypothetical protein
MSDKPSAAPSVDPEVLVYLGTMMAFLLHELRQTEKLSDAGVDGILRSMAGFTRDRPDLPKLRAIHRDFEYAVSQLLDLPPARGSRLPTAVGPGTSAGPA